MQLMVNLHIHRILFAVTQEALHVQFQGMILYALVLYDVLQEGRFVQIKHKWLICAAQHSVICVSAEPEAVTSLSLLPMLYTATRKCQISLKGNTVPSGLSLCLSTEAPQRWTTACTGRTPPILKLDPGFPIKCYPTRSKTNGAAFIFFMQKFCKLLSCNLTSYSKCLHFF